MWFRRQLLKPSDPHLFMWNWKNQIQLQWGEDSALATAPWCGCHLGQEYGVTAPLEAVSVTSVPITLERDDAEMRIRIIKGPSSLEDGFKLSLGPPVWRCSEHPEWRAGSELASATGSRLSSTMTRVVLRRTTSSSKLYSSHCINYSFCYPGNLAKPCQMLRPGLSCIIGNEGKG